MGGGRAYSGESSRDKAGNKMDKIMARSRSVVQTNESIEDQVKRTHPDTWRSVMVEMEREFYHPEYAAGKKVAEVDAKNEYENTTPRYERSDTGLRLHVIKRMREWIEANAPDMGKQK
jgi:hypothetical protein